MFALSVIIPVFNKWSLTRQCLASLSATLDGCDDVEVLVVDNASTDETAKACEPTGTALFGSRFRYLRQPLNRNFAGACNEGARVATGQQLFFLNNDTILRPGWREPLSRALRDGLPGFGQPPGAVGPLLLYPVADGFADRVQHLGITLAPSMRVSHLYEHFPAVHPLVRKVRRLQAVTAAAFMLERDLFWQLGGFDEAFINGFEDVDLCARLSVAGYWMACVSEAVVLHLCGQTPGRGDHDAANSRLLTEKCHALLLPDKHRLVEDDGYRLALSPWGTCEVALHPEHEASLRKRLLAERDPDCALALITEEPHWIEGYLWLARRFEDLGQGDSALNILLLATRFDSTPATRLPLLQLASRLRLLAQFGNLAASLRGFAQSPEERIRRMAEQRRRFRRAFPSLAADADRHLACEADFYQREVVPLLAALQPTNPLERSP